MLKSLQGSLSALFFAFVLLVLTSVGATFWGVKTQQNDALIINLAGRQRMLVQLIVRLAVGEQSNGGDAGEMLTDAENTFDQTLSALENGGVTTYLPDSFVTIPETKNPEILEALSEVRQSWEDFRKAIDVIQSMTQTDTGYSQAVQDLEALSTILARQADKVVRLYETDSTAKLNGLRTIQIIFLICALLLLVIGAWVTRQSVLKPLAELGVAAAQLGGNDLETPVQVHGPEEMRKLSQSFDGMRVGLKSAQWELIDLNNTLEKRVFQRTRELEALNVVSQEITSRLDIQQVLSSVTEKTSELLNGDVSFLCLLDANQPLLKLQTFSGHADAAVDDTTIIKKHDLTDAILNSSRAVVCGIDTCREGCSILSDKYRSSHMAAPLRSNDQIIGALCVGSTSIQRFGDESTDLLTKLANTAAIALENARLYEQAERIATLEERRRIAADMHDGLGQTFSYLGLMTDQVVELLSNGKNQAALERLKLTRETIEKATGNVRKAINRLMDENPINSELCGQLQDVAKEFSAQNSTIIEWRCEAESPCNCPHM
ncbi:MAG: type IV pili methyl-accepting chemotaxis transducer N-terminal domain-containing protein [Anaerolineales bacterium]|nr:type IV pili methyl-accepting chemotaxis transducer N-terminal domain-containing protein [Anaerolineales bacterium]